MIIKIDGLSGGGTSTVVNLRCVACRKLGTFEAIGTDLFLGRLNEPSLVAGQRRCPDPGCRAHIFFVAEPGRVLVTYPPERIDFDSTGVPAPVLATLEEAITCHATSCFVAAAIMVRKTLEELCRDRGAQGGDLKQRIKTLGTKVVLPAELLEGLDDLRLLGNDAAHIESKSYDRVGKEEVEVALDFTKEVLKAVYQYTALLSRLRALKKGAEGDNNS